MLDASLVYSLHANLPIQSVVSMSHNHCVGICPAVPSYLLRRFVIRVNSLIAESSLSRQQSHKPQGAYTDLAKSSEKGNALLSLTRPRSYYLTCVTCNQSHDYHHVRKIRALLIYGGIESVDLNRHGHQQYVSCGLHRCQSGLCWGEFGYIS